MQTQLSRLVGGRGSEFLAMHFLCEISTLAITERKLIPVAFAERLLQFCCHSVLSRSSLMETQAFKVKMERTLSTN